MIFVSDETGLTQFAKKSVEHKVEIVASDGTATHLKAAEIAAKEIPG